MTIKLKCQYVCRISQRKFSVTTCLLSVSLSFFFYHYVICPSSTYPFLIFKLFLFGNDNYSELLRCVVSSHGVDGPHLVHIHNYIRHTIPQSNRTTACTCNVKMSLSNEENLNIPSSKPLEEINYWPMMETTRL